MNEKVKKVWNIVSTSVVVLVVICAVFLMGSRLLGFQCYNVISGSMEPEYSVGDLLYVKSVDPSTIQVGDDITFILNEDLMVATHRVVRIDAEKQHFYTKGLANDIEDSEPVHYNNVIGVPYFSLPLLGYVSDFIQNPPGSYVAIGIGIVLLLLVFLPDMISKKKKAAAAVPPAEPTPEAIAAAEENERLKAELEQLRAKVSDQESE